MTEKLKFVLERVENIVEKGENVSSSRSLKLGLCGKELRDKLNLDSLILAEFGQLKNIVGKRENAGHTQCFEKASFRGSWGPAWLSGKVFDP